MSLQAIPQKPSKKPGLTTFMLVAKKDSSAVLRQILSLSNSAIDCYGDQGCGLLQALEAENMFRKEHSNGSDILYSLEDLQLGAKGDLTELSPGRRVQLTLGEPGFSRFLYKAVLLDARQQSGPFSYHCGVFLVPKTRGHEWLFSSEEGQWTIIESSKAARLIMVLLNSSHASASMEDIQKDLSPLVRQLEPVKHEPGAQIPFMAAGDGIKQRTVVHQVSSALTGPIIIDDIVYESVDDDVARPFPSKDLIFRRLTFERSKGLVQSEALLTREGCEKVVVEKEEHKKTRSSSKSKKRGKQRQNASSRTAVGSNNDLKLHHDYLASSYHTAIVSGFMLISSYLESVESTTGMVKAVVIGLGAGLLPMFLDGCLPSLSIEVVELDPVILDLARAYFGFRENEHLKVHIMDGIQFVRNVTKPLSNGSCNVSEAEGKCTNKVDILIVDVDSSDSSSGMTCPAADFVEESFLLTVKSALSEEGLFVVNLVSRSPAIKDLVVSRIKMVFSHVFSLQLEEDVNEVIFALNNMKDTCIKEDGFPEASRKLGRLLKLENPERCQNIIDVAKKMKCIDSGFFCKEGNVGKRMWLPSSEL